MFGHHRQWNFLEKKYFFGQVFSGQPRTSGTPLKQNHNIFLHGESLLRTTQKYHLEGPESRRWASTAFWFACDIKKCEKCEKSEKFKISHFSRPYWPFIMSDHVILMYLEGHRVFTKFCDANCIFHHGQSKNSLHLFNMLQNWRALIERKVEGMQDLIPLSVEEFRKPLGPGYKAG